MPVVKDLCFELLVALSAPFAEPQMYKLSEWIPYIPQKHYKKGEAFNLVGTWPLGADKVTLN